MLTQETIDQFYRDVETLKLKFPVAAIARETKFSKGQVSIYLNKNDEPSENFINKFYEAFKISLEKVSREKVDLNSNGKQAFTATTVGREFLKQRLDDKNSAKRFMVPLVPAKAQAGYATSYESIEFINELEMWPILPGIDHRGRDWRYFEIKGDSMEETLFEKEVILVSMLPPEDWRNIKAGQVYVVLWRKEVLVKIVYPINKDTWVLASSNRRVKQEKISVNEVNEVWQFQGKATRRLDIPKIEIKV